LESLPQICSRIPSWSSHVWRDPFLPVIPTGAVARSVDGEVEGSAFPVPVFAGETWPACCFGSVAFSGKALVSLVSNWKFFQRADNSEGIRALSRGKNILK
jgi:hypothetical protein